MKARIFAKDAVGKTVSEFHDYRDMHLYVFSDGTWMALHGYEDGEQNGFICDGLKVGKYILIQAGIKTQEEVEAEDAAKELADQWAREMEERAKLNELIRKYYGGNPYLVSLLSE